MSCPCEGADSYRNLKKGLIFAVIQKLMDTKIIHKLEKVADNVETGKLTKGKTMKLNIMTKTIVYIIINYVIETFKVQLSSVWLQFENAKSKLVRDNKPCFCIFQDAIVILILQILSVIYHKRLKATDLLNNIVAVYGSSFLYDMYGQKYMGMIVGGRTESLPSVTDEKTNTNITSQGGEMRVNLNPPSENRIGKRQL